LRRSYSNALTLTRTYPLSLHDALPICDNILDVKLSTPKELGGAGGEATNPEQLFAAGYSACFIGALKFVASQTKRKIPDDTSIRSEEHTSELQSRGHLVCRLLLEKKKT